jgi:hypothetical protein
MSTWVSDLNIHNVTAEETKCEIFHLHQSTCLSITVNKTTINLFMDNDQVIAIKRILGA